MGERTGKEREAYEKELTPVYDQMDIALYLQIISILMAVIAVALPALIAFIGFVYVRSLTERIDNIADQVDELWDRVNQDRS